MSADASFLQRVVAAAGATAPARTAAATRGPLTLGQFLRRRRPIFLRAAAMTLARATTEELDEEAALAPADSAAPPTEAVRRAPLVRRSVSGPAETAAGAQTAAPAPSSEPELHAGVEVARLADAGSRPARAHDLPGNSTRDRAPGSAPADAPERAVPESRAELTAEITAPSQHRAAVDSPFSVRERHSSAAARGDAVEPPKMKPASDAMPLPGGKEILTVPAYPAQSVTAFAAAAPSHLSAEARTPLPGAAGLDQAPGSSAFVIPPATEESGARSQQAAAALPAFQEDPALLLPGTPYVGATPPFREVANEASTTGPVVQIGTIEIIIEAAEPRTPGSAPPAPPQDFASRFYLRGL